jgi:hypothetical protein
MKHTTTPRTAVQIEPAEIPRKPQTRTVRSTRLFKGIAVIFSLALIVTVYVLAHRSFSNRTAPVESPILTNDQVLQVEVLDGAGNMKVAQYVTNVLRSHGYDVVEMKKNNDGIIERTYVVDRSGNLESIRKLASSLGIAPDKVFQKINRNLYLDVTVVVGKDYSRLKIFQVLNERKNH